jgi:hypothetical protein
MVICQVEDVTDAHQGGGMSTAPCEQERSVHSHENLRHHGQFAAEEELVRHGRVRA